MTINLNQQAFNLNFNPLVETTKSVVKDVAQVSKATVVASSRVAATGLLIGADVSGKVADYTAATAVNITNKMDSYCTRLAKRMLARNAAR